MFVSSVPEPLAVTFTLSRSQFRIVPQKLLEMNNFILHNNLREILLGKIWSSRSSLSFSRGWSALGTSLRDSRHQKESTASGFVYWIGLASLKILGSKSSLPDFLSVLLSSLRTVPDNAQKISLRRESHHCLLKHDCSSLAQSLLRKL